MSAAPDNSLIPTPSVLYAVEVQCAEGWRTVMPAPCVIVSPLLSAAEDIQRILQEQAFAAMEDKPRTRIVTYIRAEKLHPLKQGN